MPCSPNNITKLNFDSHYQGHIQYFKTCQLLGFPHLKSRKKQELLNKWAVSSCNASHFGIAKELTHSQLLTSSHHKGISRHPRMSQDVPQPRCHSPAMLRSRELFPTPLGPQSIKASPGNTANPALTWHILALSHTGRVAELLHVKFPPTCAQSNTTSCYIYIYDQLISTLLTWQFVCRCCTNPAIDGGEVDPPNSEETTSVIECALPEI